MDRSRVYHNHTDTTNGDNYMGLLNQIVGGLSGMGGVGGGGLGSGGLGGGGLGGGVLGGNNQRGGLFGRGGSMIGGGVQSILLSGLLTMVMNRAFGGGGLGGLLDRFRGHGLSSEADSWVSTGNNQPLTPEQVERALGPQIHDLARQAGVSEQQAAEYLTELIPQVVDRMTPTGEVPDDNTLTGALGRLLGH